MSSKWPKLTETLTGQKRPDICQSCGTIEYPDNAISVWREHGTHDEPTNDLVALCLKCSDELIEPHVRLYSKTEEHAPIPGGMPVCIYCKQRDGMKCRAPELKANGGEGLYLTFPQPYSGFWDGRGKDGRRTGGRFFLYHAPVVCKGFIPPSGQPSQSAPAPKPE